MNTCTVNYRGLRLDVAFGYTPEEKQTHDYPGADAELEIESIKHNGVDVTAVVRGLLDDDLSDIEALVMEHINAEHQSGLEYQAEMARENRLYSRDWI